MAFAFAAIAVLTAFLENAASVGKSDMATSVDFLSDFLEADTFDAACSTREVLVDKFAVETDGFENLGAAVAAERRDTHLGHDLQLAAAVTGSTSSSPVWHMFVMLSRARYGLMTVAP